MTKHAELAHLFRALKAPAAGRALPTLAERAREESWSYERFAEALLWTEVSARDSHDGEGRIKTARFPARKTLEEFDFTFQRSVKKTVIEHLGQLDFLHGKQNVILLGPPGHRQNAHRDRAGDPRLPRRSTRPVRDRHPMGRPTRRSQTPRPARDRTQTPVVHSADHRR